jgi:hypothetical protein
MFLGLGLTDWTAIAALAGLALAAATVAAILVTTRLTSAERRRDDRKRAEDKERDDRLRREAREETERREQAERTTRQDYEARQVLVTVEDKDHPGTGHTFNRQVTLSTPHTYPIKQVEGCMVLPSDRTIIGFGHGGDQPHIDEQRIYYTFWAEAPERARDATPIMRWVDWHGNRYYQYRHYTERFGQNTDWAEAFQKIDTWIRTGPNPD